MIDCIICSRHENIECCEGHSLLQSRVREQINLAVGPCMGIAVSESKVTLALHPSMRMEIEGGVQKKRGQQPQSFIRELHTHKGRTQHPFQNIG